MNAAFLQLVDCKVVMYLGVAVALDIEANYQWSSPLSPELADIEGKIDGGARMAYLLGGRTSF